MIYQTAIIGGGAAGLMTAIHASTKKTAQNQMPDTIILERNNELGKKLLLTGKGRCNITTSKTIPEIIKAFGKNGKFLYGVLSRFSNTDAITFFEKLGVPLKEERGQRMFPVSDRAEEVLEAIEKEIAKRNIKIEFNFHVKNVRKTDDYFEITSTSGKRIYAKNIVIATGGQSYPTTGSTGDGYKIAKSFGHTIIPLKPALVPLLAKNCRNLAGLTLKNVGVKFMVPLGGPIARRGDLADPIIKAPISKITFKTEMTSTVSKNIKSVQYSSVKPAQKHPKSGNFNENLMKAIKPFHTDFGEMLFTHTGVSGPIILTASKSVAEQLENGAKTIELHIDLKPALDKNTLKARINREIIEKPRIEYKTFLKEYLPASLIEEFIARSKILPTKKIADLTKAEKEQIINILKDLAFNITGVGDIEAGVITSGGVNLKEINPQTMESKIVPGLYFAGEVIDLDGPTGGFNLQVAWSTGVVAGINCRKF